MAEIAAEAELLSRYPRAVLSHESAARVLGILLVDDDGSRRITVPRNHGRLVVGGWQVRRADAAASEVVIVNGLRVTSAARTVVDLGRVLELSLAVAAGDSALRARLVTLRALQTAAAGRRAGVGAFIRMLDAQAGSVLESLLRVILVNAALPAFTTQHLICDRDGEFVARVDFCWAAQRLIVEADGFAFHSDREAYRRDRERMNELERLGWRVLRVTWEEVRGNPQRVVRLVTECLAARRRAA
ncbi:MAG: hypothetical protein JWM40_2620 [Frankiales bacterium]|nr:hypothetical protein [Frankiales bacterium]